MFKQTKNSLPGPSTVSKGKINKKLKGLKGCKDIRRFGIIKFVRKLVDETVVSLDSNMNYLDDKNYTIPIGADNKSDTDSTEDSKDRSIKEITNTEDD